MIRTRKGRWSLGIEFEEPTISSRNAASFNPPPVFPLALPFEEAEECARRLDAGVT
jgi:hypothetical protein